MANVSTNSNNKSSNKSETFSNQKDYVHGLQDTVSEVKERAEAFTSDLAERASEFTTQAKDKVQDAIENVPALIRRYPLQSMLVGFGVGLVVAKAFMGGAKKSISA